MDPVVLDDTDPETTRGSTPFQLPPGNGRFCVMGRVAKLAGGSTLIVAGAVMLVLPGPGLLTIAAGVALMADEVAWARRVTDWVKTRRAEARSRRALGDDRGQEGG